MLLLLLRRLVGLPGGALAVLVLDDDRIIGGGARDPNPPSAPGGGVMVDLGGPMGGALARPASKLCESPDGAAGLADTDRGMPLGGGGVAFLASLSLGSAFLFTQRFCSGS